MVTHAHPKAFDPEAVARIVATMVKTFAEAKVLVDAGDFGVELQEITRRARDLHDLLLEQIAAAEPGTSGYLRGLCASMENNLQWLEGQHEEKVPRWPVQ